MHNYTWINAIYVCTCINRIVFGKSAFLFFLVSLSLSRISLSRTHQCTLSPKVPCSGKSRGLELIIKRRKVNPRAQQAPRKRKCGRIDLLWGKCASAQCRHGSSLKVKLTSFLQRLALFCTPHTETFIHLQPHAVERASQWLNPVYVHFFILVYKSCVPSCRMDNTEPVLTIIVFEPTIQVSTVFSKWFYFTSKSKDSTYWPESRERRARRFHTTKKMRSRTIQTMWPFR